MLQELLDLRELQVHKVILVHRARLALKEQLEHKVQQDPKDHRVMKVWVAQMAIMAQSDLQEILVHKDRKEMLDLKGLREHKVQQVLSLVLHIKWSTKMVQTTPQVA